MVFSICEELEFLKKLEVEPLREGGREYTKYRVNYSKLQEYYGRRNFYSVNSAIRFEEDR